MQSDLWRYREGQMGSDMVGFKVEAIDGDIGKIDEATDEAGSGRIVVDTGPWIFGRKVVLPAGVIERIDRADEEGASSRGRRTRSRTRPSSTTSWASRRTTGRRSTSTTASRSARAAPRAARSS